jgi:hypothetical protein
MTKEEVAVLYEIWRMSEGKRCCCEDHHPDRKNVCQREKNWRLYCEARDLYIGKRKEKHLKIDLDGLFASIEDLE